jgi:alkylation response protein AidB-like acyl-CoA dehydrogenase
MGFPKEFGGLELPWPVYIAAMEMVGKACASTALTLAIHGTCCEGVRQFSNPDQKKRNLPGMISGKTLAAFSLTEPGAGSDARNMKTGPPGRKRLGHKRDKDVHDEWGLL